ncbi:MAG: hypothetical protein PHT07_12790 [Paludibacter sp.]|nr:hypothetical protein [Paludibacter sp.]
MNFLIEIIFRRIIARIIGLYTRSLYFKIVGKEKSIKNLTGGNKDNVNNMGQDASNAFVGILVIMIISLLLYFTFTRR